LAKNIRVEKYNTSRFDHYRFHNPDKKRNYIRIIHPKNLLFLSLIIFDYILFIFSIILKRNLIIHVHTSSFFGWWRSAILILIARIIGKKTILHVHNAIDRFYFEESGRFGKYLIRISLKIPHHLISLSHGIKNLLEELTNNPITPIYNGVDVKQFQLEKNYTKPYKMLFAGFVGPHKGVPDLISALRRSELSTTEIQLTVMGTGDIEEMKELSNELGLNNQIIFTGRVSEEEKKKLFNTHHLFALPSHGEGQPISILEGMSSGMAILSTKVGSIPEIVKDENGILVSPGDIEELSDAILQLINRVDVKKMGEVNREIACKKFTFDRVIKDNIVVYKNISQ
jgi:glycosyltransferase involved in cell wall biosynthesis